MLLTTLKSNLLVLIWLVICLMGVSFQIYRISSEYFAYKINARVKLVIKDDLEAPTISFCLPVVNLFKWKEMTQEERISILHFKNGTNITAYDALKETPATLDNINETLLKDTNTYSREQVLREKVLHLY